MQFFTLFAFLAIFAGRVLSLNIAVGGSLGNISASQFLDVSDQDLKNNCQSQCAPANSAINACTDDNCLCNNATVTSITTCQQCMFTDLIHRHAISTDPRAGSSPALTAYAAACSSAGITVPATEVALTVPSGWDGPFEEVLGIPATVVTVGIAFALGLGCITVVNTM